MMTVVAFTLAKVETPEATFFKGLHDAFSAYGVSFTLFSPHQHNLIKPFRRSFDWTIKNIPSQHTLPELDPACRLAAPRRAIWAERISKLALQNHMGDPEGLVEILERFAQYVLTDLKPDVILSWNTLCPHSGILAELAKPKGVEVYLLERGFLPHTWFLEKGGLVGHSELVDTPYETLMRDDEALFAEVGTSYLNAQPFRSLSRYDQKQNPRFAELCAHRKRTGRPMIGFFPPDDLSLAFVPVDTSDRKRHLPSHKSSLDAAVALAKAAPECDVVFKPHPSFREANFPDKIGDNLFIIDHDYNDVMRKSDVVASTGSGLIVPAMAIGKPVIQMGRDQFSYKSITYDAQTDIRPALESALKREDLDARLQRFRSMIGYMLTRYLVSGPTADAGFRRPSDAVRDILRFDFGIVGSPRQARNADPGAHGANSRDRVSLLRGFDTLSGELVLVDFDHTLMLANSTELFLQQVRPALLFVCLHWLVNWMIPWRTLRARGIEKDMLFDPLRLLVAHMVAPWMFWRWRSKARANVATRANEVLLARLKTLDPKRIVIVSNGHPWVLRPLLKAMGLEGIRLVCGATLPHRGDIRQVGKLKACVDAIPDFKPTRSVVITDSMSDADLLAYSPRGYLIDWGDEKHKANPLKRFFPFVLTSEGKYPGARVVKRHRIQEDLPIILATFALGVVPPLVEVFFLGNLWAISALAGEVLWVALACVAFFISFNAIYEIGYWENDFIAAGREAAPNVSPQMERFRKYPVQRGAWTWGATFGALGALMAAASGAPTPIADLVTQHLPGLGSGWAHFIASSLCLFAVWCAVLAGLRVMFHAHNSVPEQQRIYTFWCLHAYKLLAYGFIFSTGIAGIIVCFSQVYRHWTNYLIYRFKGDKSCSPKQDIRAFFFIVLSLLMALVLPWSNLFSATWIVGAWLFLAKSEYWSFLPKWERSRA